MREKRSVPTILKRVRGGNFPRRDGRSFFTKKTRVRTKSEKIKEGNTVREAMEVVHGA